MQAPAEPTPRHKDDRKWQSSCPFSEAAPPTRQGQQKVNFKTDTQAAHPGTPTRPPPSASLEGSKSPAELCFGRKLRTPLSLLKPNIRNKSDINTTMERQFNRHHGARRKTFKRGDSVLVKTYQGQRNWTNGQVLRCLGRVLYGVRIGEETWIRHANQLRMRFSEEGHNRPNDMDTLFEMFELERPHSSTHYSTTPQDNAVESTSTTLSVQDVPQLRRSTRTRRAPLHFVVNPSQRSYRSTGTNS
ncbi:hypothetical protein Y032_0202g1800 [Ancylostoma ceylanicum]|uniref:Uncharacterized protein n=1 Tax=Ancylostoma ceylanicum TaxID=53326 RepID=A0A016SN65_9BILA|nr:hypothetical protein Y032_0202g1800 [Ancylostoma ceylanicum]